MSKYSQEEILTASANVLTTRPYQTVSLKILAEEARIEMVDITAHFSTMHDLGTAILDHEGKAIRAAHQQAQSMTSEPLERLHQSFRLVGRRLSQDPIVRAGIRIAAEASSCFAERNINPFRTWQSFVTDNLEAARDEKLLRTDVDVNSVAWLFMASGMGTKDLLSFTGNWNDAETKLSRTALLVIENIRQND